MIMIMKPIVLRERRKNGNLSKINSNACPSPRAPCMVNYSSEWSTFFSMIMTMTITSSFTWKDWI